MIDRWQVSFLSWQMLKWQPTKWGETRASSSPASRQSATTQGRQLQSATTNLESSAEGEAPLTQEARVHLPPAWMVQLMLDLDKKILAAVMAHTPAAMHMPAPIQEVPGPSTVSPWSAQLQEAAQSCMTVLAAINANIKVTSHHSHAASLLNWADSIAGDTIRVAIRKHLAPLSCMPHLQGLVSTQLTLAKAEFFWFGKNGW